MGPVEAEVNAASLDPVIDFIDIPDRWLRVFDVVALEGSFTGAARRLGIGQPSVSHAIKQLERQLGVDVFDRADARIRLTDAGQELRSHVRPAFEAIDHGVRALRRSSSHQAIGLSVSTSFATWWLLPRLAAFKAEHPDIDLRCITSDNDDLVGRDNADLWIPHGTGEWPRLDVEELTPERIVPVASPERAASLEDPTPAALLDADLIHLEERYAPRFDWNRWFDAKGLSAPPRRGIVSNDYAVVVQAALDGQGIALGWEHIIGPLVDQGRLVRVGGDPIETDHPFLLLRRRRTSSPAVEDLQAWLIRETA
jgi:DNA-binding transcriptional LysR family regulator